MYSSLKRLCISICASLCFIALPSDAQYTILHNFNGIMGAEFNRYADFPSGSLTLSGNMLYGMTRYGGAYNYGCIFSIDTNGNEYKDFHDFDSITGKNPYGSLTYASGILYGMTEAGGASNFGCIFRIDTNGNAYRDMLDFNDTNGANPYGSLTLSGNKLYGMTWQGGHTLGCIFSIDTNGSEFKDIYKFNRSSGYNPYGSLIISGGQLFGMTWEGGMFGNVFSIDTNGNEYKNLHDFGGIGDGAGPYGSLVISGSVLYGMTTGDGNAGPGQFGNIFSIDTDGNAYKDLLNFGGATGGADPYGSLTLSEGILYGMTLSNIFSIDTNGNVYKDLFKFTNYTTGSSPFGDLTLSGNMLYGIADNGGTDSVGVIFSLNYVTAGIDNLIPAQGAINVYPNPNNGRFTLSLSNINAVCNIEIYNLLGEKVYTGILQQTKTNTINLIGQPSGVYFYRVLKESGAIVGSGKVVIQ